LEFYNFCFKAELNLNNEKLRCSEEDYERLKVKNLIAQAHAEIIYLLQKYKLLSEEMLSALMGRETAEIQGYLTSLVSFGLVIKQFFTFNNENVSGRSLYFYSVPEELPRELKDLNKKNEFVWSRELPMDEAMEILSFNKFYISLVKNVPRWAFQAQPDYRVKDVVIDGRFVLKSRNFYLGYSHMFVLAVRDCAKQKERMMDCMIKAKKAFAYSDKKMPWFVIICESKAQAAMINSDIKTERELEDVLFYFIMDQELSFTENPLHFLKSIHFMNGGAKIEEQDHSILDETWFKLEKSKNNRKL